MEQFQAALRTLAPQSNAQHALQFRALELSTDVVQMRWLVIAHERAAILPSFLVVLLVWLPIIFHEFGLHTANNPIVLATLFVCALSVSGAIFPIEELGHSLDGVMQVSSAPLRTALAPLGH